MTASDSTPLIPSGMGGKVKPYLLSNAINIGVAIIIVSVIGVVLLDPAFVIAEPEPLGELPPQFWQVILPLISFTSVSMIFIFVYLWLGKMERVPK